jgi:hypothetical protein
VQHSQSPIKRMVACDVLKLVTWARLVLTYAIVIANIAPLPISVAVDKKCPADQQHADRWGVNSRIGIRSIDSEISDLLRYVGDGRRVAKLRRPRPPVTRWQEDAAGSIMNGIAVLAHCDVRSGCAPCKGGAFQWVQVPPGNSSSRKQSEQSWR